MVRDKNCMNKFTDIGNNEVLFIRVYGRLVPIDKVDFVQVDPNRGQIIQDVPLSEPINLLMYKHMHDFKNIIEDRKNFNKQSVSVVLDGALIPNYE